MDKATKKADPVSQRDLDFVTDSKSAVMFNTPPFSRVAIYALALLIILGVFWAYNAKLDEVTVAQGTVIPSSHIQVIQNLEGGIIKQIYIQEGQHVKSGDPIMKLDETAFSSSYKANLAKYQSLLATNIRLQAQAENASKINYDPKFAKQNPSLVTHESRLFHANSQALKGQLSILTRTLEIAQRELKLTTPLAKKGLISEIELLKVKRELNDIRGKIKEANSEYRTQALAELNDNKSELASLKESLRGLKDRMQRTMISSPINGIINNLQFNTIGGVIQPGAKIVDIVPQGDNLLIEANVRPSDIAFIHLNQKAIAKFSAYDFSIYGGLNAIVTHISPTTITGEEGETYYEIKLTTKKNYLGSKDKPLQIIPGMTVSVDILTGKKSVLDYLLKPI